MKATTEEVLQAMEGWKLASDEFLENLCKTKVVTMLNLSSMELKFIDKVDGHLGRDLFLEFLYYQIDKIKTEKYIENELKNLLG